MAISFVAISFTNNGRYFFLLLHAIFSSSCYLQHVQFVQSAESLSTSSNIDFALTMSVFDPFAPTVLHFALTSTSTLLLTMQLRQWDPGIRLWDPGILTILSASMARARLLCLLLLLSYRSVPTSCFLLFLFTWAFRASRPMPQPTPTWLLCQGDGALQPMVFVPAFDLAIPSTCFHFALTTMASSGLWLSCQVDASLGLTPSALATVKSIFHYVHPVLSRPTVPNINVFRLPV